LIGRLSPQQQRGGVIGVNLQRCREFLFRSFIQQSSKHE